MKLSKEEVQKIATTVIETEAAAITKLSQQIGSQLLQACELLSQCDGRIISIGLGKSGHIARKISSTFASTGSASFFIHASEAAHGDLGMIHQNDVIVLLSNSGETNELHQILPSLKKLAVPLIAMTSNPDSTLGKQADVVIDTGVEEEACPLGLAPTASTTASLVMGDALAAILQSEKGFTSEDFAKSHPSGQLGKRLTVEIAHIMRTGDGIPKVAAHVSLADALIEMSSKGLGMTIIVDDEDKAIGVFTDGDLRRALESHKDVSATGIDQLMTKDFHPVQQDELAYEVFERMQIQKISAVPVLDDSGVVIGALNMHDILRIGL